MRSRRRQRPRPRRSPLDQSLLELHARLEQEHWWFTGRRAILDHVLRRHLTPETTALRLLDAGCGTGGNLPLLARHGQVMGFDASSFAVEHARRTTGLPVLCGSLPGPLPADLGRFDVVCLFDLLEHIEDDHAALITVRELLAPGGLLIITVPALPWLWSRHDLHFGHHRRYHRAELAGLLKTAGFSLQQCSYFCTLLFPLIAVARLGTRLLPLDRLQRGNDFNIPTLHLNRALHTIFATEGPLIARHDLPVGSSLLAVARR